VKELLEGIDQQPNIPTLPVSTPRTAAQPLPWAAAAVRESTHEARDLAPKERTIPSEPHRTTPTRVHHSSADKSEGDESPHDDENRSLETGVFFSNMELHRQKLPANDEGEALNALVER